jgi:hypothetical protein
MFRRLPETQLPVDLAEDPGMGHCWMIRDVESVFARSVPESRPWYTSRRSVGERMPANDQAPDPEATALLMSMWVDEECERRWRMKGESSCEGDGDRGQVSGDRDGDRERVAVSG